MALPVGQEAVVNIALHFRCCLPAAPRKLRSQMCAKVSDMLSCKSKLNVQSGRSSTCVIPEGAGMAAPCSDSTCVTNARRS